MAQLKEVVERAWTRRQNDAVKHVRDMLTKPEYAAVPWKERSVKDTVALKIAETIGMDLRSKDQAASGPRVFGVVVVPQRMESRGDWEKMAAAASKPVIDVPAATPALPEPEDDEPEAA